MRILRTVDRAREYPPVASSPMIPPFVAESVPCLVPPGARVCAEVPPARRLHWFARESHDYFFQVT